MRASSGNVQSTHAKKRTNLNDLVEMLGHVVKSIGEIEQRWRRRRTSSLSPSSLPASRVQLHAEPTIAQNPAATCNSFAVSPSTIQKGQSATLSWDVSNANVSVSIDHAVSAVARLGTQTVSPISDTVYTLTAVASGPMVITCTTKLTVGGTPPASPLGAPTGLNAACNSDGSQTTLTWNPLPSATHYNVGFNDSTDPSKNTTFGNFTTTSQIAPSVAGHTYWWWVIGWNSSTSSHATGKAFTCVPTS